MCGKVRGIAERAGWLDIVGEGGWVGWRHGRGPDHIRPGRRNKDFALPWSQRQPLESSEPRTDRAHFRFKKLNLALLWEIDWGEGVGGGMKEGDELGGYCLKRLSEGRDWDQSDGGGSDEKHTGLGLLRRNSGSDSLFLDPP